MDIIWHFAFYSGFCKKETVQSLNWKHLFAVFLWLLLEHDMYEWQFYCCSYLTWYVVFNFTWFFFCNYILFMLSWRSEMPYQLKKSLFSSCGCQRYLCNVGVNLLLSLMCDCFAGGFHLELRTSSRICVLFLENHNIME